jgi:hypothetical protein
MLAAAVRTRLAAEVGALAGRVLAATDLAALMARGELPQVTPAAVVLPLGLRGGETVATFGHFRQAVTRRVGVLLVVRAPQPATARAAGDVEALAEDVLAALLGWSPAAETPGVLRLEGARLSALAGGAVLYDLAFALADAIETD